jgi:hypothetical protein
MIMIDTPGIARDDTVAATRYRQWRAQCAALQIMLVATRQCAGRCG